jgi:hypothetical protein
MRADRHDKAKSRFLQFCEQADKCLLMFCLCCYHGSGQNCGLCDLWLVPSLEILVEVKEVRDFTSSHTDTYFLINSTVNIVQFFCRYS